MRALRYLIIAFFWPATLLLPASMSPAATAGAVKILPDNVCGPRDTRVITVCGGPIARDDVRRLHALASCLVFWQRRSSESAVLAYQRGSDVSKLRSLVTSDHSCTKSPGSRISGILLAGALSEAMLANRRFEDAVLPPGVPPSVLPIDCMFATGRADTITLVRAEPFSRRERSAFGPLLQKLSACLPIGQTIETNLYALRAMAAIHLFYETLPLAPSAPLQAPFLDLPGGAMQLTSLPVTPLPGIPALSIAPPPSDEIMGPRGMRHEPPRSGEPFDPEELLANEASPQINPETGETIVLRPGREERRDKSDPY